MCVILHCESTTPEQEILETCEKRNGDGIGLAYFEDHGDSRVTAFEKGIDLNYLSGRIEELPFPYAIHFRKETAGGVQPELCHPFPINERASVELEGQADRVLMHNGTISDWEDVLKFFIAGHGIQEIPEMNPMSDSRAAAFIVHHLGNQGEQYLPILSSSNRFLIMNANDEEFPIQRWGHWKFCITLDDEDESDSTMVKNNTVFETGVVFSNSYWNK